jgi:hypothetical protein
MFCKNCIHYDICQYHIDEETDMTVNECPHEFKHKEQYVKLPAFVGQKVWIINRWLSKCEICEGKVSMLQQKADKSWKIRVSITGSVQDYTLETFEKEVYLSKAEAEKALLCLTEKKDNLDWLL